MLNETNTDNWRKLLDLQLSKDKWSRVSLFCNLLGVSCTVCQYSINFAKYTLHYSMLTKPSRLFLLLLSQLSTMLFLLLNLCSRHGKRRQKSPNTMSLCQHSRLQWRSLRVIMKKLLSQMHILWPWVSHCLVCFHAFSLYLNC